jgi:glycosyltransferase involved in cell wall biosynthesis
VPILTPAEKASTLFFWNKLGLAPGQSEFVACFLGTVGRQFDLETALDAAMRLQSEGYRLKVVICGVGEKLNALKQLASGHANIVFPGWVDWKQIWALMCMADVGLAPYIGGVGFERNIPNKVIEYLAAGLPIVSSLGGDVKELLERHKCGVTYRCGDSAALAELLKEVLGDRQRLVAMSGNAKRLFETTYGAEKVYGEMIEYLREVGDRCAELRDL